jgi:glycerol-3-phosphate acyltransferase PlsX
VPGRVHLARLEGRGLTQPITIAVDAMGGDHGPAVSVPASLATLAENSDLRIVLVGRADILEPLLEHALAHSKIRKRISSERLRVQHASELVAMDERPQDALRKKKDSSMRVALDLVKAGEAQACVSAGNTGALMATARFVLKMIPGIDRPAILSRIPARHGHTHMLDLGANADCTAEHLLQFALMGSVVAADLHELARPRIGLLNIGEEDIKGNEVVQQAGKLIAATSLNYVGFVEGNDIFSGDVDVVVTDGFTGNVALKTMEGAASLLAGALRSEFSRTPLRRLAALAAWPVLSSFKQRFDPRAYNGASMIGLTGVVVKSHGGADTYAFGRAISVGLDEIRKAVATEIGGLLAGLQSQPPTQSSSQARVQ